MDRNKRVSLSEDAALAKAARKIMREIKEGKQKLRPFRLSEM